MTDPTEQASGARWSHFPHGADLGVCGMGMTRAAAFEQVALALFAAITDPADIRPVSRVAITCRAPNDAVLLVDWLNALIYEAVTRKMLFGRFDVRIEGGELRGEAWGEPIDPSRHHPAVEPKGATFTELRVGPSPINGWIAQCVVDV
ncbi:MAG TPA: archease [Alphaproteobacteria bacterium]|nr:archease [Alphaproteobacteria bacterium]